MSDTFLSVRACGKEINSTVNFPDNSEYSCMDCRKLSKLFTYRN